MSKVDPDAELVLRAQRGDRAAFEQLVRRHADRLYGVVLRVLHDRSEAEEVTQEAFIRAWRGIGRFKQDAQFFTWLYRIGINEARRRSARRPPGGLVSSLDQRPVEPVDRGDTPQRRAERDDLREALARAVRALEPDYRAPLILRDIEGLSTAEASAIMGLGEAAFKSRLHRARLSVREAIDDYLLEDNDDPQLLATTPLHARALLHARAPLRLPRRRIGPQRPRARRDARRALSRLPSRARRSAQDAQPS